LQQEIGTLFSTNCPTYVVIKADEGRSKTNASIERSRNEAIIYLSLADIGLLNNCKSKRKNQLAKDLCGIGKGGYLQKLDKTLIDGFDKYNENIKDAILCGWSALN